MKLVIQRVTQARLEIDGKPHSQIGKGMVVLLGISENDETGDVTWLVNKMIQMRIFNDMDNKMNLSVQDVHGDIMIVSQFTLLASTQKGNRPSYIHAAKPEKAKPLYELFILMTNDLMNKDCATGIFGADMQVHLINDGPVTIIIDSHQKT